MSLNDVHVSTYNTFTQHYVRILDNGVSIASCLCMIYDNGKAYIMVIDDVKVKEDYRNRGLGTRIIEAALNLAEEEGVDCIELIVNEDNEAARGLYKKMGFEETNKKHCRRILNIK